MLVGLKISKSLLQVQWFLAYFDQITNLHDDDFGSVSVRLIYDFSNRIWSIVFQMHRDKLYIKNNSSFHRQWKPF